MHTRVNHEELVDVMEKAAAWAKLKLCRVAWGWKLEPGVAHALTGANGCANIRCKKELGEERVVWYGPTHEVRFCRPECIDHEAWVLHMHEHNLWSQGRNGADEHMWPSACAVCIDNVTDLVAVALNNPTEENASRILRAALARQGG